MDRHSKSTLTHEEWLGALHALSLYCANDRRSSACEWVREVNALLVLAPEGVADGVLALGSARLDELVAVNAPETAIIAMLDYGSSFMLSYGPHSQAMATIVLPGGDKEISCAGATPALALIAALALSLATAATVRPYKCKPSLDAQVVLH